MSLAAQLRHRVDIEALTLTRDSYGGAIETWTKVATSVPAAIVPLSGKEFIASGATQAQINTRITLRYRDDLKPAMRLVHGATLYNIRAVLPDPTLQRHLTLLCEAGVNDG